MKLCEFYLRSYGSFKDHLLRFDALKPLQFIYGENEAGKTTFSRAFLSLLYGIDKKSTDTYLFPLQHLYLQGLFQNDAGQYIQIIREKKSSRKTTQTLQDYFPKVSREAYSNAYVLNHKTLKKGAENLLKLLGQFDLEFLEASGVHSIKKVMNELEKEREGLFKLKGKKPVINSCFSRYEALFEQSQLYDLSVESYESQLALRDEVASKRLLEEKKLKRLIKETSSLEKFGTFIDGLKHYQESRLVLTQLEKETQNDLCSGPFLGSIDQVEKIWLIHKESLSQLEKLQQQLLSKKESLKRIKELEKQPSRSSTVLSKDLIENLEEEYSKLLLSKDLLAKSQNLTFELKQQERMIARLAKELDLKEMIKELLANEQVVSLPDLAPLEKKYQQLKAEWNEHEKRKRATFNSLEKVKAKLSDQQWVKYDTRPYIELRAKRKQLEPILQKAALNQENFHSLLEEYFLCIESETQYVDQFLENTEAFSKYQNNSALLEKGQLELKELEDQEKSLLLNRKEFEKWMQSVSPSRVFSFHEFGLFKLYMSQFSRLTERIDSYNKGLGQEKDLINQIALSKEKLNFLLKKHNQEPSEDFKESLNLLKELIKTYKEDYEKSQKNIAKQELLEKQTIEIKEDVRKIQGQQSELKKVILKEIKVSNQSLESILELKQQLEGLIKHVFLRKEQTQKVNFYKSQIKKLRRELLQSLPKYYSKEQIQKDFDKWSCQEIDEVSCALLKELSEVNEQVKASKLKLSELDKKVGEVEFQLKESINHVQKLSIEGQFKDLLFELEEGIHNYLINHLSSLSLSKVAKSYQEKYQFDVMQLASDYFSRLTLGAYNEVCLDVFDDSTYLKCVGNQGKVGLDVLSEGTRDQLYLALKLAFIEKQTESKEAFPILLDDILVQFDDLRATAALKLLQSLSSKRQLIFLTHHAHVLKLIEKHLDPNTYEVHSLSQTKKIFQEI